MLQPVLRQMRPELLEDAALDTVVEQGFAESQGEIDGGIDPETAPAVAAAGCDLFVAGSAVYGADDVPARIADLRRTAARHTCG